MENDTSITGESSKIRGVPDDTDMFSFTQRVVENPNYNPASTNEGQTLYPDLSPEGEAASLPTDENETTEPPKPDPSDELRQELIKTEEEINTLRQVLQAKEVYAADLRKKLGLTPLNQLSQSFKAELNKVQSSNAYQSTSQKVTELNEKIVHSDYYKKTSETLKSAGQSTASAISSLGSSMSQKLSEMKNSQAFKSFEEKVEGVGSTIMAKVSGTGVEKSPETAEEATEITPVTTQPHQSESNPTTDPPPL
ncbi:uncharacterized protein LOC120340715 isoform X1 [Styela clava]